MSQDNSIVPNSSNSVNGISKRTRKKRSDENSQGPLYFGKLTENLQSEIDVLRPAYNAISNIGNIFQQYRTEVEAFENDFGAVRAKDEEIKQLNAAMRWLQSDNNEKVKELEEKLESSADERESLRVAKKEFETTRDEQTQQLQRKQGEFDEKENQLEDEYKEKIKKAKEALKKDTSDKIAQLKTANKEMAKEIETLKADVVEARETLKNEKEDWSTLRSAHKVEIERLCKELDSFKKDLPVEIYEDDFYKQRFLDIQGSVKEISSKFFSTLPHSPGDKRKEFEALDKPCKIAEYAFLSDSSVSRSLRLAAVEFLIVDSFRELVWQPFAFAISLGETASATLFQTLSRELSKLNDRAESTWRALTVYGLRASSAKREGFQHVIDHILKLLAPFTDKPDDSELSEVLHGIVQKAADVWDISQRDARPLLIHNAPDPGDGNGWMREDEDLFDNTTDSVDENVGAIRSMDPVCIFPKVARTPSPSGPQTTIFRGRALFKDSHLLTLGRKESTDLQTVMNDVQRQFASQKGGESGRLTRSDRRLSIAAQATPA